MPLGLIIVLVFVPTPCHYSDMKKAILSAIMMLAVLPQVATAQFAICEGTVCTACDLVYLVNQIITWLVGVLMMLFAVLAVKAGFGLVMSKGNSGELTKAKDSFVNAFVGLLIILSAWLIVDTMIRGLGVKDATGSPLPWSEIKCQAQAIPRDVDRRESPESASIAPAFAGGARDGIDATRARDILRDAGVSVQQGVSLSGISESRVQEITQLARECQAAMGRSCGIQVSSGVRFPGNPAGVGAHGSGLALDLSARHSPVFNEWMRSQQTYPPVQSFGGFSGYRVSPSTVCTWEGPDGDSSSAHWHCAPPTR